MPIQALQVLERKIERQIRLFELRNRALGRKLERKRYPEATVVQGDAYRLRMLLTSVLCQPAAAVVSGLPLFTKPLRMRLRLLQEAFGLMAGGAPFVQFTYAAYSPIPRRLERVNS